MARVLIACEESQRVCAAFRERGYEAYSCDIIEPSDGHPEWHILGDALEIINPNPEYGGIIFGTMDGVAHHARKWDLIIAHPPCTKLSIVATRHHSLKCSTLEKINARTLERIESMNFFMQFALADCDRIAIENPRGVMNTAYRKPDQTIDPYMFAESAEDIENYVTKATCLWLKGLPLLKTNDLSKPDNGALFGYHLSGEARNWTVVQSGGRGKQAEKRSKTFTGVARAMAEQWGAYLESEG